MKVEEEAGAWALPTQNDVRRTPGVSGKCSRNRKSIKVGKYNGLLFLSFVTLMVEAERITLTWFSAQAEETLKHCQDR